MAHFVRPEISPNRAENRGSLDGAMDVVFYHRHSRDRPVGDALAKKHGARIVQTICEPPLPFPGAEQCLGPKLLGVLPDLDATCGLLLAGAWCPKSPIVVATALSIARRAGFPCLVDVEVLETTIVQLQQLVLRMVAPASAVEPAAALITRWANEGKSSRWIVGELARREVLGPRGGPWGRTSVRRVMRLAGTTHSSG